MCLCVPQLQPKGPEGQRRGTGRVVGMKMPCDHVVNGGASQFFYRRPVFSAGIISTRTQNRQHRGGVSRCDCALQHKCRDRAPINNYLKHKGATTSLFFLLLSFPPLTSLFFLSRSRSRSLFLSLPSLSLFFFPLPPLLPLSPPSDIPHTRVSVAQPALLTLAPFLPAQLDPATYIRPATPAIPRSNCGRTPPGSPPFSTACSIRIILHHSTKGLCVPPPRTQRSSSSSSHSFIC